MIFDTSFGPGKITEPKRQLEGQPRKIVGFHLDENLDPPWTD